MNQLHEPCEPYSVLQFLMTMRNAGVSDQYEMKELYQRLSRIRDHHYLENLDAILRCTRISFEPDDCESVVNLFLDDQRLLERLSGNLRACYMRAGRMDEDCVNRWYDA